MKPIQVLVHSSDPIKKAGVAALLGGSRDISLLDPAASERADVVVLVESTFMTAHLNLLREVRASSARGEDAPCGVVVTDKFDENDTLAAVQTGVMAVLPSVYADRRRLVDAVTGAATGSALLPRQLQSALLRQLAKLREEVLKPNGLTLSGLGRRELDALRLVAEGFRTDEIATKLSYSEGTVKSVLYGAIRRLGLANRTHAVAYAIRTGALP